MRSSVSQIEALPAVRGVLRPGLLRIKAKSRQRLWLSVKISVPEPFPQRVPMSVPRVVPADGDEEKEQAAQC